MIQKYRASWWFIILLMSVCQLAIAQTDETPKNWLHLDPEDDGYLGISSTKAQHLLEGSQAHPVVVAVIDNGAELSHEDLTGKIWVNMDEIPENGIDDDNNGYVDDVHGWNFLGNAKGENLKMDNLSVARAYQILNNKYGEWSEERLQGLPATEYAYYTEVNEDFKKRVKEKEQTIEITQKYLNHYSKSMDILRKALHKQNISAADIEKHKDVKKDPMATAIGFMQFYYENDFTQEKLQKWNEDALNELKTRLNPYFANRVRIVGDNPDDINDVRYGNNQLDVKGPYHGTAVASVIAGVHNGKGPDGIAPAAQIMVLRVIPNGDERDKDVALAIRYAIRNGASIINCSFGKDYSLHSQFVTEALAEAEREDVLIIVGAGNNSRDIDQKTFYPLDTKPSGERPKNFIRVGSNMPKDNADLVTYFSNYGKKSVDLFAPGVKIPCTGLGNTYDISGGTSISAPIVAGIAATLKSYYPHLTAKQIQEALLASVYIPRTQTVSLSMGDEGETQKKRLNEISVTGGIANMYNAVRYVQNNF